MRRAWENDGLIDKSEAHILELVKQELGVWEREHYILMHDASIIELWDLEQEYYAARNQLLATGIVLTFENKYVVADEVAGPVRKTFGIEMMDDALKRLLSNFSREDLTPVLSYYQLNVSGVKDIMIERLVNSLIPTGDLLNQFHSESLRDLCRKNGIASSGSKETVVNNIIHFFDEDNDIREEEIEEIVQLVPVTPELREMDQEIYAKVLMNLTRQELYDVLYQSSLVRSGSKDEKVKRILESNWSERSIFNNLRKEDLAGLLRKFGLAVSGSKQELVDRVLDYVPAPLQAPIILTPEATELAIAPPANIKQQPVQITTEAVAMPVNWDEINQRFPDLRYDEKIVLAVLKDAKSITEQDLERIVNKYSLGWFLYKANMAELMAKLKNNNHPVIQIKSIQNINVYQWLSTENLDNQVLEKKSARDIIDALRHGVVPRSNLDLLMVGQVTARNHLSDLLLEVNAHKSHFKFIRGQYGSGKTFLCSWLKEYAINHEFAVSFINISHDQPLSDLPIFFSGLVNGLRTPEKSDSSALVDILEAWLLNIHNKTATIEGIKREDVASQKKLNIAVEKTIETELANFNDIEPGFSQALRAFYEGKINGDKELVTNAVAWITGSRSLSAQALRDVGVKGYLEANNVFPRMRALLEIVSGARYKGMLLLVDELELIRKFPHARQREQALETLRLLIDEAGRNALPGCLVIFTGTDEFFEDKQYGLRSYEALADRVETPFTHENFVSMRQPIIRLDKLDRERLSHVILKIRDLYATAYSWNAREFATDESINRLVTEWTTIGDESVDRKPRPVLREFIQMLDLCEENKGVELAQFLKKSLVEESTLNPN